MQALQSVVNVIRGFMRFMLGRLAKTLDVISRSKITPNSITALSLVAHFPLAFLIATRHNFWSAGFLFVFGLLDAVDGPLARLQNRSTSKGMLLDSITNKIKEVLVYIGAAYAFMGTAHVYYAVWAVAACGVSLLVSYVNAWGEAMVAKQKLKGGKVNQTFREGLMTYDVRMTVFFFGLLANRMDISVVFIAVVSLFTALGRVRSIMQRL